MIHIGDVSFATDEARFSGWCSGHVPAVKTQERLTLCSFSYIPFSSIIFIENILELMDTSFWDGLSSVA